MGISAALGSSALLPAGLGFRNLLINGDFRINQRGFTSTTTDLAYTFDRWRHQASGGSTCSAQTFTVGNAISGQEPQNYVRLVTTGQSGSGVYTLISQTIENVRSLAGQQVAISFYAKAASGTPSVAVDYYQDFGTGGSPSSAVSGPLGKVTLSTSWQRYTIMATMPSIAGKTVGTNNNSYVSIAFWVSAGTNFDSRTTSLGIQSNTFDFWGMQVEQNYQPTPFEQRPIGVELQLCQRYFQIFGTASVEQGFGSSYFNSAVYIALWIERLITQMRAAPTIAFTTPGNIYNVNTATTYTGVGWVLGSTSDQTFYVYSTTAIGTANGQSLFIYGQRFSLSAEL